MKASLLIGIVSQVSNMAYGPHIFFHLTLELETSDGEISSEDSPPEKQVNGRQSSVLPSQVPSHLLMISILEHLCQMYAQDAEEGKKLFQGKYLHETNAFYVSINIFVF